MKKINVPKKILDNIQDSEGIIFIYSQFIDAGIIPLALALEHHGYKRYGNNQLLNSSNKVKPATPMGNYIMITSDTGAGGLSFNLKKHMNILNKTRTYLVGHMQYASGRDWRDYVEEQLRPIGIRIFNPYKKPFVKDVKEDEESRNKIHNDMEEGHYNDVSMRMKQIRSYDLNLVDRSDFIVAHLLPDVASWGSAEEIVTAVRMKKPIGVELKIRYLSTKIPKPEQQRPLRLGKHFHRFRHGLYRL